jgi:hypothetical protein
VPLLGSEWHTIIKVLYSSDNQELKNKKATVKIALAFLSELKSKQNCVIILILKASIGTDLVASSLC